MNLFFNKELEKQFARKEVRAVHRYRQFFYLLTIPYRKDRLMNFIRYWKAPKWEKARSGEAMKILQAVPVQMGCFISLFQPPAGAGRMFQDTFVPLYDKYYKDLHLPWQYHSYVCDIPQDFLATLEAHGCKRKCLPSILGGRFFRSPLFDLSKIFIVVLIVLSSCGASRLNSCIRGVRWQPLQGVVEYSTFA